MLDDGDAAAEAPQRLGKFQTNVTPAQDDEVILLANNQPIARGQNQAVEPENVEDEVGQGIAGRRSLGLVHLSP